jgi:AraC-like DNA-binding protein
MNNQYQIGEIERILQGEFRTFKTENGSGASEFVEEEISELFDYKIDVTTPDVKFLIDMDDFLKKNFNSPRLNVQLITSELGMSHSVIYKKMKALTGCSLVEYIRDYRLTKAAKLLSSFNFSVVEACYEVGFNDRKYFSKMFKNKFNTNPSDYAKTNRE